MRLIPFVFVLAFALPAVAQEAATAISSSEGASAVAGEILVEGERGDINRGEVIGFVNGPVDEVAAIVRDIDRHETWFPDTETSTLISSTATTSVSEGRTGVPLVRDRYWRLDGRQESASFNGVSCEVMYYAYDDRYEDGNMEELYGYWLLCPEGNGTLVKYVINADLGIWLPNGIITWAQRRMLPGIIEGLQERHAALHP